MHTLALLVLLAGAGSISAGDKQFNPDELAFDSIYAAVSDSLLREIPSRGPNSDSARAGRLSYDKFADQTAFTSPPIKIGTGIVAFFSTRSPGKMERPVPGRVGVLISSRSREYRYNAFRDVVILIDDSIRIRSKTPTYLREIDGRLILEHLGFNITFASLVDISKSKKISIKIASDEFDLPEASRIALADFASRFKSP